MTFINEFFKNKSEIGAVAPSSKYLRRKMNGGINFDSATCIVEFGPGTGIFTHEIIQKMRKDCFLLIFETNQNFYEKLKTEINDERVLVLNDSAELVHEKLVELGFTKTDYIISSLPLTVFPKEVKENILKNSKKSLKKDGKYIQFQYSLNALKMLKGTFQEVSLSFTFLNVPPAFVYTCKN